MPASNQLTTRTRIISLVRSAKAVPKFRMLSLSSSPSTRSPRLDLLEGAVTYLIPITIIFFPPSLPTRDPLLQISYQVLSRHEIHEYITSDNTPRALSHTIHMKLKHIQRIFAAYDLTRYTPTTQVGTLCEQQQPCTGSIAAVAFSPRKTLRAHDQEATQKENESQIFGNAKKTRPTF